ncbi:ATP-dependent helicase brm [Zootermopsis nevadensis]|uniref:ATP-dependent helicase brm n=1 Tax=Zootermopsis nevadensis TaxID=136037 RepID=A0A067QTJ7_ZOONE|nr:ATP-dependent helicase brm [Zootermopsis nevadensis]
MSSKSEEMICKYKGRSDVVEDSNVGFTQQDTIQILTASFNCNSVCAKVLGTALPSLYSSFFDLERDFIQMCRNAQKYNEEASLIHEDSIVLETVFANARVRLEQDSEPAEEEDEEEEEEEGEENPGWDMTKLVIY